MKSYKLVDFLTPQREQSAVEKEMEQRSRRATGEQSLIRRPRSPEEKRLIMEAIKQDFERLKREGVLETNGRKWKFHI